MKQIDLPTSAAPGRGNESVVDSTEKDTRNFVRIAAVSTAIGCGYVAATVASLHGGPAGTWMRMSPGTFVAFAIGAAVGFLYWRFAGRNRSVVRWGSALLVVAAVAAYVYPLRFVAAEQFPQLLLGLVLAACAISTVGLFVWVIARALNREDAAIQSVTTGRSVR